DVGQPTELRDSGSAMSSVSDILSIAHDALLSGQYAHAFAIFAELGPDFEYQGRRTRLAHPRPYFDEDPSEDEEPEPLIDQRRRYVKQWRAIEWTAWREPPKPLTSVSMDAIMRAHYPIEAVGEMSMRRNGALSAIVGSQSLTGPDAYEVRIRSWANVIRGPGFGVAAIDGD